jgi:hypothetical protein
MADADKPWYIDPTKLVPVVAGVIGAAIGVTQLAAKLTNDEPPRVSAEYILDVSSGMKGQIGKKPKLGAVEAEILTHVRDIPSVSTALRLAGPSCSSGYRKPDVQFAENNGDKFTSALRNVRAGGESNFANALSHAVNDLIGPEKAASSKSKSVYIFVAGPDTCSSRPLAVVKRALHDLRPNKNVELNLKFVGVKAPPEVKALLRSTRKEAQSLGYGAAVEYANKPSELDDVLPDAEGGPTTDEYDETD